MTIVSSPRLFLPDRRARLAALAAGLVLIGAFAPTLVEMARLWVERSEYGHGLLMPPVAAWMIWERRRALAALRRPACAGWMPALGAAALVPVGAALLLGEMKLSWFLKPYAFVGALAAWIAVLWGWKGLLALRAPLVVLALMCPLPYRVMMWATLPLKRAAAVLATGLMDLSGLHVTLSGNMIHIPGIDSLWIADACSGLRSAVSLVSVAILASFFWRRHWLIKLFAILSCVPIAILVNGVRIWSTAMLSVHVSPAAAQGFFHVFEGFLLFGMAALLAFGWAALLHVVLPRRAPPGRTEAVTDSTAAGGPGGAWMRSVAFVAALVLTGASAVGASRIRSRLGGEGVDPAAVARMQRSFAALPLDLPDAGYRGEPVEWDTQIIANSGADAYRSVRYVARDGRSFQVYLGGALRNDDNFHAPNVCMPASGWEMLDLKTVPFRAYRTGEREPRMERMLIQRGRSRMLVYFWFQAGGRLARDEWRVRFYRLLDLLRGRELSPAIIVCVYVPVKDGIEATEAATRRFLQTIGPYLRRATSLRGIHGES